MRSEPANAHRPFNVLFLCTANSARSIMAEAILARLGAGKFNAFSAGSHPRGDVHPRALALLAKLNHKTDTLRSKSWAEFASPGSPVMDFVITVCNSAAGEACPVWPGQPIRAHWGVDDPAAEAGTEAEQAYAFADAYRMLERRISIFVNLPLASLDRMAIARRVDALGRAPGLAAA